MSELSQPVELPSVVEAKLRAVRRRIVGIRTTGGLILTATVLLLVMMVAMAIDWMVVLFDHRWRMAVTLSSLAFPAVTLAAWFVRPLLSRHRLASVARVVDRSVPSLEERWSTVTELAESTDPPQIRGAEGLIRQVSHEATKLSHLVAAEKVVSKDQVRRCSIALGAALAILALALLLAPAHTGVLIRRFWAPRSDITLTRITSLTGDRVVAKTEPLILEAETGGRQRETATLFVRGPDGEQRLSLTPSTDSLLSFTYKLRSVQDSFDYRFRCGDGQTPWCRITAVDRPSIAQARFQTTPPAYSKLPTDRREALPRRCRALRGTDLDVSFLANKPLSRMELRFGDDRVETLSRMDGQWYGYRMKLTENVSFSVLLVDQHGLTNVDPPFCRIVVYADQPPSVEILSPDEEIVVRPDDTIKIEFKASDDFGIATAELMVAPGEREDEEGATVIPIPLGRDQDAKVVRGRVELDLKPFQLKHGSQLNYAVRVADTRHAVALSEASARASEQEQELDTGKAVASEGTASEPTAESQPAEGSAGDATADGKSGESEAQAAAASQATAQASEDDSKPRGAQCSPGAEDTQQSRAGAAQQKGASTRPADASSSPPPSKMTMRQALNECTACSKQHRIQVDKWVGSFDGQARKKLQIAIDAYLKRLDAALAAAQAATDGLCDHVRSALAWDEPQARKLSRAREHLADADKTIVELKAKSADTPYAFIGLQLHEIGLAHVAPARQHLAEAGEISDKPTQQLNVLDRASYHIERARAMLAALTKKYEAVKQKENLAEAMERVAKMHQIFVEDMQALLKANRPTLNPRTGKMVEVSDEFVAQLEEYYKRLKQLMDELAKILADDPDLLRRFLALMRLDSVTLRDQLTILSHRQEVLHEQVGEWIDQGPEGRPAVQAKLTDEYRAEQMELAEAAAQLYDNMITWMPRDVDASEGPLAECRQLAAEAAVSARELAQQSAAGRTDRGLELADALIGKLNALHKGLFDATSGDDASAKLAIFAANRMAESQSLISRQGGWIEKIEALRQGSYGGAAVIDQDRLAWDTVELGVKLDRVVPMLARISDEGGRKARQLEQTVSQEVPAHQVTAAMALKQDKLAPARQAEGNALESFAKAEKLFDEVLDIVEQAAKMPPGAPRAPTLEGLLAMLENECKACEKLGAALRLNVAVQADWAMPGSGPGAGAGGSGAGSGGSSGSGSAGSSGVGQRRGHRPARTEAARRMADAQARAAQAYAEKAAREMAKAQQNAAADARKLAATSPPDSSVGPPEPIYDEQGLPLPGSNRDERDWNVFVSRLQRELRQGRDIHPPKQYRRAIDEYFRTIAEMAADRAATP